MASSILFCPQCQRGYHRQQLKSSTCPQCQSPLKERSPQSGSTEDGDHPTLDSTSSPSRRPSSVHKPPPLIQSGRQNIYQVLRVLGQGGGGKVYEVKDPFLKRSMALKTLPSHRRSPRQRQRFIREIIITSNLEHPNIMPVYEGGTLRDGTLYFVMKEIRGQTLKDQLRPSKEGKRSRPLREYLEIFLKVCDAVEYAHSKGVIHRDLKPSNIAVGEFGEVIVMDWGLAKYLGDEELKTPEGNNLSSLAEDSKISLDGAVLGTPSYMAPEQANGEYDSIGPRSDVFSLGAVLYHILALSPPFKGKSQEVLYHLLTSPIPRPRDKEKASLLTIPPALEAIALKALSKENAQRYESVRALALDVQAWLEERPVSVYSPPWKEKVKDFFYRHASVLAVMTVILLIVAIFSFLLLRENRRRLKEQQKKIAYQNEREGLLNQKLTAEEKARREREEKIAAQHQLIEAQKKREEEMAKNMKATRPYMVAMAHMHRNLKFSAIKMVIIPQLKKALAINPDFLEARWTLVQLSLYLNRDKRALAHGVQMLHSLAKGGEEQNFIKLVFRVLLLLKGGLQPGKEELPQLIREMDKARPDFIHRTYWEYLKALLFFSQNHSDQALKVINELEKTPEGKTWFTYLLKANLYLRLNNYPRALKVANTIIDHYPYVFMGYLLKAVIHRKEGNIKKAVENYKKVAHWDPSNHMLWSDLEILTRETLKYRPGSHENLAFLLARRRYLQRVLKLEGNYGEARRRLDLVKEEQRNHFPYLPEKLTSRKFLEKLYQMASESSSLVLKREFALFYLLRHPSLAQKGDKLMIGQARRYLLQYKKKVSRPLDSLWIEKALESPLLDRIK